MNNNNSAYYGNEDQSRNIKSFNDVILDSIMSNSQDTIYFKDRDSRFSLISKSQAQILGIDDPSEAIGKTDYDYFKKEFAALAYEDEQRIMRTGIPVISKVEKIEVPNRNTEWVSVYKYPLYDTNGNIIGTWGISRIITNQILAEAELESLNTELVEANKRLELLTISDSLSGLFNQRHFYTEGKRLFSLYNREKEKGLKNTFSLILYDIDNFKNINDCYGHLAGDLVIKNVGELLKNTVRSTDTLFRYAGDEFVVLLPNTSIIEAKEAAQKIIEKIDKAIITYKKSRVHVTISGGIASYDEADNINDLIEIADKRMYTSKENGRNRVT